MNPTPDNLIFGIRTILEAIEAGKEIDKIFIKKDLAGDLAKQLFDAVKGRNIPEIGRAHV